MFRYGHDHFNVGSIFTLTMTKICIAFRYRMLNKTLLEYIVNLVSQFSNCNYFFPAYL